MSCWCDQRPCPPWCENYDGPPIDCPKDREVIPYKSSRTPDGSYEVVLSRADGLHACGIGLTEKDALARATETFRQFDETPAWRKSLCVGSPVQLRGSCGDPAFGTVVSTNEDRREITVRMAAGERKSERARDVVDEQADDEGLWFAATTTTEAYLQQALRRLHAAVESSGSWNCAVCKGPCQGH